MEREAAEALEDLVRTQVFKQVPCANWYPTSLGSAGGWVMMKAKDCAHGMDGCFPQDGRGYWPEYARRIQPAWDLFLYMMEQRFSVRSRFFKELERQSLAEATELTPGTVFSGLWALQAMRHRFPEAICRAAVYAMEVG